MTRNDSFNSALDALRSLDFHSLEYELQRYQGIRDWAIKSLDLGYGVDDRVQIVSPIPGLSKDGWRPYAECLGVGSTGVVKRIEFSLSGKRWVADFVPDHEWATSSGQKEVTRYWHGPVDETPDGYEPPSSYEAEHYPLGRKHTFMFDVEWLIAAPTEGDV